MEKENIVRGTVAAIITRDKAIIEDRKKELELLTKNGVDGWENKIIPACLKSIAEVLKIEDIANQ